MIEPDPIAKKEITARLKALNRDRAWLAESLHVSEGVVNQWLAPSGYFPTDRYVAMLMLLDREERPVRIGDPDGNLLSFTIEEFERIEATRQSLHYATRPELYRDAIIAFVEADEQAQAKVVPMGPVSPAVAEEVKAAEAVGQAAGVPEPRREVRYEKPKRGRKL